MFCINCGKQIVDTARFCNYCGVKVVNFDENPVPNSAEIPENPISIPVEDVKIPENVENSVDLLKMQSEISDTAAQVNEMPEGSDTAFSENETLRSNIQSGAVGAQHSSDVTPVSEPSDMQYDGNIPQSEPITPNLGQSAPTGAIPGQLPTGTPFEQPTPNPGQSVPGTSLGQSAPITPNPEQSAPTGTAEPPKPTERRYTLGHIIMCLASTALMAIVAGVFAGLYFSVV